MPVTGVLSRVLDEEVVVSVRDHGVGIPQEAQERMWAERFPW